MQAKRIKIRPRQVWKKRDQGMLIEVRKKAGNGAWMTARLHGGSKACHKIMEFDLIKFYDLL